MLRLNKEEGYNYQRRRREDWRENYTLYRDKVITNRLTQRQSVNLPLMKQSVRTLLKDVDDMPLIFFENLDNAKQSQVFQNEYWKYTQEINNMTLQDIVDKKQVFLSGRTFDQWQIINGQIKMTIQQPEDIVVSRHIDPTDLHSSRYLTHLHIFIPFSELSKNPMYDKSAIESLRNFFGTKQGIIKASDNKQMFQERQQKMADMGLDDAFDPILGEMYVEISLHFAMRDKETRKGKTFEDQLFLYVEAENQNILMKKPLEEVIGSTKDHFWQNHFPYNSWADDLERVDFWSDGVADIVRTPNKILNSWFSQLVENRTLRNYGMHYYNSSLEGFNPQTFQAIPWGWYPVPGNPKDVLQKVEIPDLSDSLDEIKFVIEVMEKATGATATQQGAQTERQITLGEVKLALGEAKERIKGMSKFYTPAWKQRGEMFLKLIEAAPERLDAVRIYKKGRNTSNIFSREVAPKDWMTELGYRTKVWSQDEKNAQDSEALQKASAVKTIMPDNPKVDEIYKRKAAEFADFTPEEINEVMEYEERKQDALLNTVNPAVAPQQAKGGGQSTPALAPGGQPPPPARPIAQLPPPARPVRQLKKGNSNKKQSVKKLKNLRKRIKSATK